jgi:hypothetical protein
MVGAKFESDAIVKIIAEMEACFSKWTAKSQEEVLAVANAQPAVFDGDEIAKIQMHAKTVFADRALGMREQADWLAFLHKHGVNPPNRSRRVRWSIPAAAVTLLFSAGIIAYQFARSRPVIEEVVPIVEEVVNTPPAAVVTKPAVLVPSMLPKPTVAKAAAIQKSQPLMMDQVQVFIASNAWSDVFVDGNKVGRLPSLSPFLMKPGNHVIRLQSPFIRTEERRIQVPNQREWQISIPVKLGEKAILVRMNQGDELFINSKQMGSGPEVGVRLPFGSYMFVIKRDGVIKLERKVLVSPSTQSNIEMF